AAMIAGIGVGLFADASEAVSAMVPGNAEVFEPDDERHRRHLRLYEDGYLAMQTPLHAFSSLMDKSATLAHKSVSSAHAPDHAGPRPRGRLRGWIVRAALHVADRAGVARRPAHQVTADRPDFAKRIRLVSGQRGRVCPEVLRAASLSGDPRAGD